MILTCDTARSTRKGVEGEDGRREKGDIVKIDKVWGDIVILCKVEERYSNKERKMSVIVNKYIVI